MVGGDSGCSPLVETFEGQLKSGLVCPRWLVGRECVEDALVCFTVAGIQIRLDPSAAIADDRDAPVPEGTGGEGEPVDPLNRREADRGSAFGQVGQDFEEEVLPRRVQWADVGLR